MVNIKEIINLEKYPINDTGSIKYRELTNYTRKQLNKWNVKYHMLFLGKPAGDFYIDDKGTNADIFFEKSLGEIND